jgi:hypothetical protein
VEVWRRHLGLAARVARAGDASGIGNLESASSRSNFQPKEVWSWCIDLSKSESYKFKIK